MSAVAPAARRRFAATPALALLIAIAAAGTILTVWAIEHAGYVPCELCLAERNPFYAAVPLALVTAWAARREAERFALWGFVILAVLFVASAGLAAYHTGVEWQMWAGPTGCSGPMPKAGSVTDMMQQLQTIHVVRCDAPALVLFGLSLAAWNVVVSLILAALAAYGVRVTREVASRA